MNDFTASNGLHMSHLDGDGLRVAIPPDGYEGWQKLNLHASTVVALREFFQAEADERLGRWRSKLHPDCFAVWMYVGEAIHVCSDKYPPAGRARWTFDRESCLDGDTIEHEVAREFFDAHPEPKPWHDAQPGEVWVLETRSDLGVDKRAWHITDRPESFWALAQGYLLVKSNAIVSGRRIWPEVSA